MSSLRTRTQNQLLTKLGAVGKVSKNAEFDMATGAFEKTSSQVSGLDAALRGFIVSLKGFHVAGQVLMTAIESIGANGESSPEMHQFVGQLRNCFQHTDTNGLLEVIKIYEDRILKPSSGWVGQAAGLKQMIHQFQEQKMAYDYYTRKVTGLREARDKRSMAGKTEKSKDVEKLVRNEQKLAEITKLYMSTSERTISTLETFVISREQTLTPLLLRLLEFRVYYTNRANEDANAMRAVIENDDAKYSGILSTLEAYANNATKIVSSDTFATQQASGSEGITPQAVQIVESSAQAVKDNAPVKTLSFEDFTGNSPPTSPQEKKTESQSESSWGNWLKKKKQAASIPSGTNCFNDDDEFPSHMMPIPLNDEDEVASQDSDRSNCSSLSSKQSSWGVWNKKKNADNHHGNHTIDSRAQNDSKQDRQHLSNFTELHNKNSSAFDQSTIGNIKNNSPLVGQPPIDLQSSSLNSVNKQRKSTTSNSSWESWTNIPSNSAPDGFWANTNSKEGDEESLIITSNVSNSDEGFTEADFISTPSTSLDITQTVKSQEKRPSEAWNFMESNSLNSGPKQVKDSNSTNWISFGDNL